MIGNTDFAFTALHNIVLISDSAGVVYPVPYDFDWSGVISAPYARPDSRLGIATVRIRTYRGTCRTPDDFAPLFARFNAAKDSIYALYRGQPDLEPKRVERSEEQTSELQSRLHLVCRLLLEKKKKINKCYSFDARTARR